MLTIEIEENEDGTYMVSVLDMREGSGCWEEPEEDIPEHKARELAEKLLAVIKESFK